MTQLGEIALVFLGVSDQMKVYHWQTTSYARHKASDDYVTLLSAKIDQFMETIQGTRSIRVKVPSKNKILLSNLDDKGIVKVLKNFRVWLLDELPKYLNEDDNDLQNIIDEIVAQTNQTLYLFTFN